MVWGVAKHGRQDGGIWRYCMCRIVAAYYWSERGLLFVDLGQFINARDQGQSMACSFSSF